MTIHNLVLGGLGVLLALWGQHRLRADAWFDATLLYGLGIVALLVATRRWSLRGLTHGEPQDVPAPKLSQLSWLNRLWRFLPGTVGIGLSAWALWAFNQDLERPAPYAWWCYLAGILLFLLTTFLLDWGRGKRETHPPHEGRWLGWLVFILAVGVFMRLYRFAEWPFGTWYDEAAAGLLALRMVEDPAWRPVFPGSINITFHYTYLIAQAFNLFGVSTESIRAISVCMGILTIPAAFLAGREFFGRTMGLVFAFVMAVARWNINFSRIGMYNIATPLFALASAGFLLRGLRRNRYRDYGLAGLSFGLGLCFYPAFQLFVAAAGLLVLYALLTQRGLLRRSWFGLSVMVVMAVLVVAPLALFAYKKPDVYFSRTQDTSLLATTTPENRVPALLRNTRKHLLMFNYRGDPNGRHNLPGEPMLDPYSGALMVLGIALCLRWIWQPRALFLLLWFGITLLGGILSLDFEAPQSLRSIGSQPAAYLLACVPIYLLWLEWRAAVGRYYPHAVIAPLMLLLIPMAFSNFHTYYVRQTHDFASWNAYSTPETIAANLLAELPPDTQAYVISFFHGHPTINFLARNAEPYQRLDTTDQLPLPWPSDQNVMLIVNAEGAQLAQDARRLYPNAEHESFAPPFGGPTVVEAVYLDRMNIESIQGLTARYYANETWSGDPALVRRDSVLAFDWQNAPPLSQPFSVEWNGILRVEEYGEHRFFVQTTGPVELYIGEELVLQSDQDAAAGLVLAQGNHAFRLRAVGSSGPFSLSWRPPARSIELIPPHAFYVDPVTSNGLRGAYFANGDWQPPEAFAQIDARFDLYFHVTPLPRPYTVEWTGKIAIPQSGVYRFGMESADESALYIDGRPLVEVPTRNQYREAEVELDAGLHDIRLRYADRTDHTHIRLYWAPPGGMRQIIPPEVLFPPQGNYERIAMPEMEQLVFDAEQPGTPTVVSKQLTGDVQTVLGDLSQPRGIAIGPDGTIYVADTGNRRLLLLSDDGTLLSEVAGPQVDGELVNFGEPFDVAVDRQGQVYVLDSSEARLSLFDADGQFVRNISANPLYLGRARGLFVDEADRIWLASTALSWVFALDQTGELVDEFPVWPEEDAQPVDLVVNGDSVFVTDANLRKLIRFDMSGRRLFAWDIAAANTLDGPHLTVDEQGNMYMTEPEAAKVTKLAPDGERLGEWTLPMEAGQLPKPIGITVDASGNVWFADVAGGRVFRLEPLE